MSKYAIQIELLKTKTAYERALKKLSFYFDHPPKADSKEDTEFQLLMLLVERYEQERFSVPTPDPIAAIQFEMEQRGMEPYQLSRILGSRQRAHEVLKRKRKLSLLQIRALIRKLKIPAQVLIQDYDLAKT